MRNSNKNLELLVNVAIIIVAMLLGTVLARPLYVLPIPKQPDGVQSTLIKPGTKLSLSGLDWNKGDQTLLMVLSTNCRFCTESSPFYQRLVQQKGGRGDVRLVAVLPQSVIEAQKYLSDHDISVDEVRQSVPGAFYANATPTLILVDRTGSVVESWAGKLPPQKELEVLDRFLRNTAGN